MKEKPAFVVEYTEEIFYPDGKSYKAKSKRLKYSILKMEQEIKLP